MLITWSNNVRWSKYALGKLKALTDSHIVLRDDIFVGRWFAKRFKVYEQVSLIISKERLFTEERTCFEDITFNSIPMSSTAVLYSALYVKRYIYIYY